MNDFILFKSFIPEAEWLSNFAKLSKPIEMLGQKFPTAEHAYQYCQAVMLDKTDFATWMMEEERSAREIKIESRIIFDNLTMKAIQNSNKLRIPLMLKIIRKKFGVNEDLKQKLMATGQTPIIEEGLEKFWSGGITYNRTKDKNFDGQFPGKNVAGKVIMKIRQELTENLVGTPKIFIVGDSLIRDFEAPVEGVILSWSGATVDKIEMMCGATVPESAEMIMILMGANHLLHENSEGRIFGREDVEKMVSTTVARLSKQWPNTMFVWADFLFGTENKCLKFQAVTKINGILHNELEKLARKGHKIRSFPIFNEFWGDCWYEKHENLDDLVLSKRGYNKLYHVIEAYFENIQEISSKAEKWGISVVMDIQTG